MACAGVRGAFQALEQVDMKQVETRCQHWQEALAAHRTVLQVRRSGAFRAGETGVLMVWFLSVPHAFRLAPPLTATDQEMEDGLALVLKALDSVT